MMIALIKLQTMLSFNNFHFTKWAINFWILIIFHRWFKYSFKWLLKKYMLGYFWLFLLKFQQQIVIFRP